MEKSIRLGLDEAINEKFVRYADGDMIIYNDVAELQELKGTMNVDLILCVICASGRIQLDVNGKTLTIVPRDMLLCPPHTRLDNYLISPDFRGLIFGLSYTKFQYTISAGQGMWSIMMYVREHPVCHLTDAEIRIGSGIFNVIREKLESPRDYYFQEVMHALMIAVFYEIGIAINRNMKPGRTEDTRQSDLIFKRFIELLAESDGKRRSVSGYAKDLCITPKYLSAATRAASGKSAMDWIHEYAAEAIAHQLKYSDRSIKEIAGDFHFSSLSVFGKFVKAKLGLSPREYRARSRQQG